MNDVLHSVFSVALIAATLTYLTPILFASIGGAITQQGDNLNIGLEGMMLIGAFAAIAVGAATNNPLVGVLAAVASSLLLSAIYAVFALWLKADFIVVGTDLGALTTGSFNGVEASLTFDAATGNLTFTRPLPTFGPGQKQVYTGRLTRQRAEFAAGILHPGGNTPVAAARHELARRITVA